MKNTKQTSVKLLNQFDNQLKNILLADLKALNIKSHFTTRAVVYTMTAA